VRAGLLRPPAILLLLAGACSGSTSRDDVPLPTAVVPSAGYATVATAVEIAGSRFFAKGTQPSVGGGATLDTHHRAWLGDVELADVTWVDTSKLTATVPAGLPLGAQKLTVENALGERGTLDGAFTVLSPPSFSATVSASPTTVSVGQGFTVSLAVSNDGSTDVNALALGVPALSPSSLATLSPPAGPVPPAPATLATGRRQSFTWTYQATAPGRLAATFGPTTGKDALLGGALTATPPAPAQVTIQQPAAIAATLSIPPSVAVGADFGVAMTVANTGGADASAVAPDAPVASSAGAAVLKSGPTPTSAVIQGGRSATFSWTYTAKAARTFNVSGGAAGKDANSGTAITAPAATSNSTRAGSAAIIATVKSAPASAAVGQAFPVVVTFSNPGTAGVNPLVVLAPTPPPVSGPVPTPAPTLAAGQSVDLTWSFEPSAAGKLAIAFNALGFDSSVTPIPEPISGFSTVSIDVTP
jgi:hypothetical protein